MIRYLSIGRKRFIKKIQNTIDTRNKFINLYLICLTILFIVTLIYVGIIDNKKVVYEVQF